MSSVSFGKLVQPSRHLSAFILHENYESGLRGRQTIELTASISTAAVQAL